MYHFIINPNSRSGRGEKIWNQLYPIIKAKKIPHTCFFTQYQGHATQYVRGLTIDGGFHTLVALGGDGTINEVLQGIVDYSKITLGYIPSGSSNDFARGFSLPQNPVQALERILHPKEIQTMDIGHLSYQDKERLFGVSAGLGFDASICHIAAVSRMKKYLNYLGLGKLTYVFIALQQLALCTPQDVTISFDEGLPTTYEKTYFVAAMNHQYEGGGFQFAPMGSPKDGTLDFCIVSKMSKLKILLLLVTAYKGYHRFFKGIYIIPAKKATLSCNTKLALHTDGEPLLHSNEISITTTQTQIRVIT